jgi:hypothetical protein
MVVVSFAAAVCWFCQVSFLQGAGVEAALRQQGVLACFWATHATHCVAAAWGAAGQSFSLCCCTAGCSMKLSSAEGSFNISGRSKLLAARLV